MHHVTPRADVACACTTLRKASRAVTRLYDEALDGTGMTIVQFSVLRNLEREGALPLIKLAEVLVMERTTLYRALEPLERQGWISTSLTGGRAKTAVLTHRGRQALAAAMKAWQRAQQQLLGAIDGEDWAVLEGALSRIVGAAQGLSS